MKKLLLIFLLFPVLASSQWLEMGKQKIGNKVGIQSSGVYQWALDFDGSTEYLSTTPALRLTGEYSLYDNFSDGNYDGWTVSSGAYSVVDSVPLSGGTKSLKCTTAGIISIPCNQSYGQWEFDLYKGADANIHKVYFIDDQSTHPDATGSHKIQISSTEYVGLFKDDAVGASSFYSATSYVLNNTWYRCKVTRNTNGQFYLYIKGGIFGSDYVLVSVTGGSGTNPVTDNTYTSSNYFVLDLDANDMIANIVCQQGEGSLDLNSYERIYHSDNRNFTKTGGLAWVGAGTHSIDTTSTDKRTGSYSGKVISTDVGDSTTNYISLPAVNFDTLKTDANSVHEKYTLEFWVKSKALSRVIVKVGNQVKTSDTISNIAFEKVVFNFQSNALVSNQPILLYLNQADTVYLDDVSLTKGYDITVNSWVKPSLINSEQGYISNGGSSSAITGFRLGNLTNNFELGVTDATVSSNRKSAIISGNTNYNLLFGCINRTKLDGIYILKQSDSASTNQTNIGKINGGNLHIGQSNSVQNKLTGQLGHISITKFTDISQSNVNSTTLTTAYNRGKLIQGEWTGGSPVEVAFYDWKGADATEMLRDKSGTGNNLTGTNIDLNDRVKVKSKFK